MVDKCRWGKGFVWMLHQRPPPLNTTNKPSGFFFVMSKLAVEPRLRKNHLVVFNSIFITGEAGLQV